MAKELMKICRISKLKGFDNLIAGRDFANIFKEGHVYSVDNILDTIIIKDLGKYAIGDKCYHTDFPSIMMDGKYLLTEDEYKKSLKAQENY